MNPVLIDLLTEGLQQWLRETTNPPSTRFPQYNQLIDSQSAIGWEQLLFGRWSQLWAYHQLAFLKRNNQPITPTNHGDGWASQIITLIWSHCHDEWLCRNQALHGKDMKTRQLARATKAQFKIRFLYDIRSQCSPYVQSHWYYGSPEEHFERETSTTNLENWIAAYETRIITHILHFKNQRHRGQRTITDFLSHTTQDFLSQQTQDDEDRPLRPSTPSIAYNHSINFNASLTSEPGGSADEELQVLR
jgi:hypothetical protein